MEGYQFSIFWLVVGLLVSVGGILIVRYYKEVSDNLAHGVSSYQKVKAWGVGFAAAGILMALNVHMMLLELIANLIFSPNK
ncbi:MAG: hypothetical protein LBQ02_04175 [Candidatus Nomurabacteria bacterium]|jgi:hypothetical protein|nr:hypothetical protein [Candidatus Nomurabacteria bacterium]